ncbi:hypothetical protein [Staphylococcus cohnii]|nr:hypothetical protein [Staphylococcus cohnii]
MQTIDFLINELNVMCDREQYWYQYRDGNRMRPIDRDKGYVAPIKHVKRNVNKIKA